MKKRRYSEEQIIGILKENEAGISVEDLARKHGVAAGTIYRCRNQYGCMEVSELKKLKVLEAENTRLKRLVADLRLDNQMLKEINSKTGKARSEAQGRRLPCGDIRCRTAQMLRAGATGDGELLP